MSNPPTEWNCNGTTLFIKALAGELRRDEILSHFLAFGDVRSVRIRNKPTYSYGYVKFAEAESATRALEIEVHEIAGRRVEIDVAHDRQQDETTFMDLNDDCILGILSVECLSALDLCSVAETHPRLKQIAGRIFRRKHSKCNLVSLAMSRVAVAQRILRNFGSVISDLWIYGKMREDHDTRVLVSVVTYCSNTLESLDLRGCVIRVNFPGKLSPIFNNLRKLAIHGCRFEGARKELFADCGSLVELELNGRTDFGFIVENTFPKLQKFMAKNGGRVMNLDSFLSRHKNLTAIEIWNDSDNFMSSILQSVADNCKRLDELAFNIQGDVAIDLSNFGHLKKLTISQGRSRITALHGWHNLQFLESLTLRFTFHDSKFIQTLSQLKRLKVLTLCHCRGLKNWNRIGDLNQLTELELEIGARTIGKLDFVLLIKRLNNLKVLSVAVDNFKMDSGTYSRIVDVVRARPDKTELDLRLIRFQGQLTWFILHFLKNDSALYESSKCNLNLKKI